MRFILNRRFRVSVTLMRADVGRFIVLAGRLSIPYVLFLPLDKLGSRTCLHLKENPILIPCAILAKRRFFIEVAFQSHSFRKVTNFTKSHFYETRVRRTRHSSPFKLITMTGDPVKLASPDLFQGGRLVLTDAERKKEVGVTVAQLRVFGIFKDMSEIALPGEDPVRPNDSMKGLPLGCP
jgi:hypothetical protein